ncbi:putative ribonuclease H-like domain-containing protein [Tanacetum coccineum]
MGDFHHLDDARDIWLAVKARFGGNEESNKMRKTMLKQEFQEFRVSKDKGLHKGYDRALPSSWSQVAITLKAKGGLDYLNFDDLYNKLKSLEIDIKGGSSYKSNHNTALSHSAFVSTTSANNKMLYAETSKQSSSYTSASPGSNVSHFNSGNIVEDVLHSFVAESDPQQQIIYEDFDQIGKLDLEELDIKWKMAMLSVRINRFEKKARRKMKFNNRDAARFDKKKVRCYKCSQLGHFARECTGKQLESNARYSAFKLKEMEQDKPAEPKALLSVDSMVNWSDHEESADDNASQVYGMIAGCDDEDEVAGEFALMGVTSQIQTCPFGCHDKNAELQKEFDDLEAQYKEYYIQVQTYKSTLKTLEQQKAWYQSNQLAYEEKIKVLERDLENTTNLLIYSENVNNNVNLEKQELQTKLDNALARFAKWKETSKNLVKLVDSSMSVKTKIGLGYGDYIGEDEVYYPTMPSIFNPTPEEVDGNPTPVRFVKEGEMNAVPPPITRKFMPTSIHSDFDESQMTYVTSLQTPTTDFASCDSSDKSSPKSGDSSVFSDSAAESESTSKTDVQEDISFNNTPTVSCNKDGLRHYVKKKSSGFKSCFVCGSYSHLIKDCDFYENRMGVYSGHRESRPMWKNVDNIPPFVTQAAHGRSGKVTFPAGRVKVPAPIPTGRQTGPAHVYAGTPVPADGQNRPTPVHASRPFPAGRRNSVLVSAG